MGEIIDRALVYKSILVRWFRDVEKVAEYADFLESTMIWTRKVMSPATRTAFPSSNQISAERLRVEAS